MPADLSSQYRYRQGMSHEEILHLVLLLIWYWYLIQFMMMSWHKMLYFVIFCNIKIPIFMFLPFTPCINCKLEASQLLLSVISLPHEWGSCGNRGQITGHYWQPNNTDSLGRSIQRIIGTILNYSTHDSNWGGHLNIKMPSYQSRDSHYKDKTVS